LLTSKSTTRIDVKITKIDGFNPSYISTFRPMFDMVKQISVVKFES